MHKYRFARANPKMPRGIFNKLWRNQKISYLCTKSPHASYTELDQESKARFFMTMRSNRIGGDLNHLGMENKERLIIG